MFTNRIDSHGKTRSVLMTTTIWRIFSTWSQTDCCVPPGVQTHLCCDHFWLSKGFGRVVTVCVCGVWITKRFVMIYERHTYTNRIPERLVSSIHVCIPATDCFRDAVIPKNTKRFLFKRSRNASFLSSLYKITRFVSCRTISPISFETATKANPTERKSSTDHLDTILFNWSRLFSVRRQIASPFQKNPHRFNNVSASPQAKSWQGAGLEFLLLFLLRFPRLSENAIIRSDDSRRGFRDFVVFSPKQQWNSRMTSRLRRSSSRNPISFDTLRCAHASSRKSTCVRAWSSRVKSSYSSIAFECK